jgi:glyoxylase-like metal-dependent hydrolase (beta-lactamase superfamily II)
MITNWLASMTVAWFAVHSGLRFGPGSVSLENTAVRLSAYPPIRLPQPPIDTVLKKEELAPGIYLFRAPSDLDLWTATNVVVVVNERDVTVFDSNSRAVTARKVIAEIRRITDKPVRVLINSHWHMDHWSGNDEYAKAFPGVQIIATTESRDYMKRISPAFFANGIATGLARSKAELDSAVRSGKQGDGTPLTPAARARREWDIRQAENFEKETRAQPHVLPNLVFRDTLIYWSGAREFRLFSATGDATASTVLYLPKEQILVTGDVLVGPEEGDGPPPWTTNSYAITPWLASLKSFDQLDTRVIVPGQGIAFHDKAYLRRTIALYSAIIAQVHAALEGGAGSLAETQTRVNVDSIGIQYTPGAKAPAGGFSQWVSTLVRKVYQESRDGVMR